MPSAIGPDHNLFSTQPNSTDRASRKAVTSARLRQELADSLALIAGTLALHGPTGKTERNWSSLRPNENFLEAYVSGTFGNPKQGDFDQDEFEEAQATLEGWTGIPNQQPNKVSAIVEHLPNPARSLEDASGTMNPRAINRVYERYVLDNTGELNNLRTALFSFAPMEKRHLQCRNFLKGKGSIVEPNDIIQEFWMDLCDRVEKGQYHIHDGNFHRWIATKWGLFFAGFKTAFYAEFNLTSSVHRDDFEDEEGDAAGQTRRSEIDLAQARRDDRKPNDASSLLAKIYSELDNPESEWGKLSPVVRKMLQSMRSGATKEQAAKAAGVSADYGRKLLREQINNMREPHEGISLQARAAPSRFMTAEEAAGYLGGLNSRTVTRWAREGYLPAYPIGEGKRRLWRFLEEDLQAWMLARRNCGQIPVSLQAMADTLVPAIGAPVWSLHD